MAISGIRRSIKTKVFKAKSDQGNIRNWSPLHDSFSGASEELRDKVH